MGGRVWIYKPEVFGTSGNNENKQVDLTDSARDFGIRSILMVKSKISKGGRNAGRNGSIGTGGSQFPGTGVISRETSG